MLLPPLKLTAVADGDAAARESVLAEAPSRPRAHLHLRQVHHTGLGTEVQPDEECHAVQTPVLQPPDPGPALVAEDGQLPHGHPLRQVPEHRPEALLDQILQRVEDAWGVGVSVGLSV